MTQRALQQLEALRSDAVERARLALLTAQRAYQQAEEAWQSAQRRAAACERALLEARSSFSRADSVAGLHAAEARLVVLQSERRALHECVLRHEQTWRLCHGELGARQRALQASELARRTVARTLEQRAAELARRSEQQAEDELEDSYRARMHGRAHRD